MTTDEKNKPQKMNPKFESVTKSDKKNSFYYSITDSNKSLKVIGLEMLDSMSDEEREMLGNKSSKLHFKSLLGLGSKKSTRTIYIDGERIYDKQFKPIGVTLSSDEDIEVPELRDITMDNKTGINLENDITYRTVKAGESFHLTLYEFMYLIVRPEYAGYCEALGYKEGLYLSVKSTAYHKKKVKLPTPTLNLNHGLGSIRGSIVDIDYKTEQEKWVIRSGYERFEPFLKNTNKKKKININRTKKIAIALKEELMGEEITQSISRNLEQLVKRGEEILKTKSIEEKRKLGSKSSILHLKNLLVINRTSNFDSLEDRVVGMTFVSDEDIQVPVIDILKNKRVGINFSTDISYLSVRAGEPFIVTDYEFMYLIIRDEYAGFCSFDGDKIGAYLHPNLERYFLGKDKLPFPKLHTSYNYTPETAKIYRKLESGEIQLKPQYIEKFGALIE